MKKLTLTLISLLFLSAAFSSGQKQNYVVGFYNLENLFDIYDDPAHRDEQFLPDGDYHWTETKYRKKLHNMATVIRAMKDDNGRWHTILGISEIENRFVIEDLVSQPEIADANYQIVHYDGPDRRGVDVALLYDPQTFKYVDSKSIPFDFEGTEVKIPLDSAARANHRTRDILMVRGKIAGEDVAFFVAHLPARIGGWGLELRCRGAEIIYKNAMKLQEEFPGIKIAVMGDMNDNPQDGSMSYWLHGKKDMEEVTPVDFFDPFYQMILDGYGSTAYRGEWSIFDIVMVNHALATAPEGGLKIRKIVKNKYYGRVFHKPFMTQQSGQYKDTPFRTFSNGSFVNGYSDHYPTYIVISK